MFHFWHEDDGFQKSNILNKAIANSKGEYIIQSDGDCILHPDFAKDHLRLAKKDTYLYGSRVSIKKNYLEKLFKSKGIKKRTRTLRVPFFSSLYHSKKELSKKMRVVMFLIGKKILFLSMAIMKI